MNPVGIYTKQILKKVDWDLFRCKLCKIHKDYAKKKKQPAPKI